MIERIRVILVLGLCLTAGEQIRADESAKGIPVTTVKGRVILDVNRDGKRNENEKGIPDILVSDGVRFVRTAADGSYTIEIADDPLIPYRPARVLAVSWPSGLWPVAQRWSVRLSDIKPGQSLDFFLREDKQGLPFTLVHGTDPHNDLRSSDLFRDDINRMGKGVQFCVLTGDLGYMARTNADKSFASIAAFTQAFPVPLFHTPGNHDICDIHTAKWSEQDPLAGYGPYTKSLGPIRWSFDYAGVHIVGLDWARIVDDKLQTGVPDGVIDWLKKDLGRLRPGTRTLVFMHHHYRHGDDRFWDILVEHKVELLLAGHSHRNLNQTRRGIQALTTMNLCGPYRLLTVHERGHAIVDRCFAGTGSAHAHSYAGACKMSEWKLLKRNHGLHKEVVNLDVTSSSSRIEGLQAKNLEIVAEIEPGTARKYGVRVVPADPKAEPLELVFSGEELQCGDIATAAVTARGQKVTYLRLIVNDGVAHVFANNRVHFQRPFQPAQACTVSLFADGCAGPVQQG